MNTEANGEQKTADKIFGKYLYSTPENILTILMAENFLTTS
jgi:hypothetical protein